MTVWCWYPLQAKRAKLADRMAIPACSLGHTSPTFVFRNWLQSTIAWAVPALKSFSSRSLRTPPLQLCQLRRQSRRLPFQLLVPEHA